MDSKIKMVGFCSKCGSEYSYKPAGNNEEMDQEDTCDACAEADEFAEIRTARAKLAKSRRAYDEIMASLDEHKRKFRELKGEAGRLFAQLRANSADLDKALKLISQDMYDPNWDRDPQQYEEAESS